MEQQEMEQIYLKHHASVYRLAYAYCKNRAEAEDITFFIGIGGIPEIRHGQDGLQHTVLHPQGTFRKRRGIHLLRKGKSGQAEQERTEHSKKLLHGGKYPFCYLMGGDIIPERLEKHKEKGGRKK